MAGRYHSKAAGAASSEEEEEEGRADPFAAPLSEDQQERARRYLRPGAVADLEKLTEDVKHKHLLRRLQSDARDQKMAAVRAADAEILLPETEGYLELEDPKRKTKTVTQYELRENVDLRTAANAFSLSLDTFGPYTCSYTRNGRYLLLSGEKGHTAIMDWKTKQLVKETHVKDMVYDSCFLQNETWYALAQSKNVHIYDKNGVELHILKQHNQSRLLDFLPYHWLLTSAGATGWVHWTDVSTGDLVRSSNTRNGPVRSMRQNPATAVMFLGHARGLVTLWTPNMPEPTVKMMCHRGPVQAMALDRSGNTLVTAGVDSYVNVWDLRTYQKLRTFKTSESVSSADISGRGLLALATGTQVNVYGSNILYSGESVDAGKDSVFVRPEPYMRVSALERLNRVHSVRFCPFEDVLGVARTNDFSSTIIPGSGEPNFDSFEANPFMQRTQRREADVRALLDKAPPTSIVMNPYEIGSLDPEAVRAAVEEEKTKFKPKFKSAGKNKTSFREKRKMLVADRDSLNSKREKMYAEMEKQRAEGSDEKLEPNPKRRDVLDRFEKKAK